MITYQHAQSYDTPILATQVEHEVEFDSFPTLRSLAACEMIWRGLVLGRSTNADGA